MRVEVGDKVYIPGQKRPYKVRARDDRYIICTKPYNPDFREENVYGDKIRINANGNLNVYSIDEIQGDSYFVTLRLKKDD